ncbi:hypothetical protein ASE28_23405 [Acidovorax sp. Root219]|nr:hypothetical protein ASE28_23405 [Acidovorax sp. Root219]
MQILKGVLDVEHMGASVLRPRPHEKFVLMERVDQMRELLRKGLHLIGVADGEDDVRAEELND